MKRYYPVLDFSDCYYEGDHPEIVMEKNDYGDYVLYEDVKELIKENETLKKINANLMGDDENVPRYTTKRLKQEIAKALEQRKLDIDRLKAENEELQNHSSILNDLMIEASTKEN